MSPKLRAPDKKKQPHAKVTAKRSTTKKHQHLQLQTRLQKRHVPNHKTKILTPTPQNSIFILSAHYTHRTVTCINAKQKRWAKQTRAGLLQSVSLTQNSKTAPGKVFNTKWSYWCHSHMLFNVFFLMIERESISDISISFWDGDLSGWKTNKDRPTFHCLFLKCRGLLDGTGQDQWSDQKYDSSLECSM